MSKQPFDADTFMKSNIREAHETSQLPEGAVTDSADIDWLFSQAPSSDYIDSIHDWWTEKGFLTEAQYAKLQEMAERDDREPWR